MTTRILPLLACLALLLTALGCQKQQPPMGYAVKASAQAQIAYPNAGTTEPVEGMLGSASAVVMENYHTILKTEDTTGKENFIMQMFDRGN